jgi:tripartite ATP-independent transporter DctP family solute receptor
MTLKRLYFLLLLAVFLLAGCASDADIPEPDFVLTYAENQPEGYPTVLAAQRFAELVTERTEGKVIIQVKHSGEFGSESEVLDQMAFGGIDFARVSLAELSDEIPKLNVLQLPFLYTDADHMWRILDGEIGEEFLTVFSEADLVGLSWYDAGARCFYTNVKPIRSPDDMKGLTVRVQDSQLVMDMVKLLGATPVTFPYGDVSYAFEMGKINAAENNWPAYEIQKHYKLAKFFTVDEHSRVPEIQLASRRTWDKLPEEYREIIAQCARESALYQRQLWKEQESRSRMEAIGDGCIEIIPWPDGQEAFRALAEPLYEQYCSEYMDLVEQIRNG